MFSINFTIFEIKSSKLTIIRVKNLQFAITDVRISFHLNTQTIGETFNVFLIELNCRILRLQISVEVIRASLLQLVSYARNFLSSFFNCKPLADEFYALEVIDKRHARAFSIYCDFRWNS